MCLILCDLETSKRGGPIWAVEPQRKKKKVYARVYYQLLTFSLLQQPKSGKARLIFEVFRSHSGRHKQPVGLLWTSDQLVAEAPCARHTTNTIDEHPCLQGNSSPRFQESNGRRHAPCVARPLDRSGFLIGIKYFGAVVVLTRNLWKSIPA
jgi:hypothetical protein